VDVDNRYAGIVIVAEARAAELSPSIQLREILHHTNEMLLPQMAAQEAISVPSTASRQKRSPWSILW